MKAAYGTVAQIRDVPSQGVTRIVVELPVENHVELTTMLYGKSVLVTIAPPSVTAIVPKFGIVET